MQCAVCVLRACSCAAATECAGEFLDPDTGLLRFVRTTLLLEATIPADAVPPPPHAEEEPTPESVADGMSRSDARAAVLAFDPLLKAAYVPWEPRWKAMSWSQKLRALEAFQKMNAEQRLAWSVACLQRESDAIPGRSGHVVVVPR